MSSLCQSMKEANIWETCAWVMRGKQRKIVVLNFSEKPIYIEEFRKKINSETKLKLSLREMSRHFNNLSEKKIIACLTKKAPYGKLYKITSNGLKIKQKIDSISN